MGGNQQAAKELIANLSRHLGSDRETLIVTHKEAEPVFAKFETPFKRHTSHWGALDGSNEWRDCDSLCIASLPRRPDSWATSSYFAITGDVDEGFLGEAGDATRRAVQIGQVVSDVAQAIGRTRCRAVVDGDGNCHRVDVFLFLPDSTEGATISRQLVDYFHGCQVIEFSYEGKATRSKVRVSRVEEAFSVCLRGLPKGTTTAKEIRLSAFKGCSPKSWERLAAQLVDATSKLHLEMVGLGIAFMAGGRGGKATFVRN